MKTRKTPEEALAWVEFTANLWHEQKYDGMADELDEVARNMRELMEGQSK